MKSLNLPFYLTGGTALSRGYFNHRYSDDLDLFVNSDNAFPQNVEKALNGLINNGFNVFTETMNDTFTRIYINAGMNGLNKHGLKIDFVNDIESHFGDIKETPVYYKTDSIRNILSNKYTALYRMSAKDIVDILEIAKHFSFSWKDIIEEADQKEAGIDLKEVSEIFRSYDESSFARIKWIKFPDLNKMKSDISKIAYDMIIMGNNTLCHNIQNCLKYSGPESNGPGVMKRPKHPSRQNDDPYYRGK